MAAARVPMPIASTAQVTNLLLAWGQGDERAFEQLVPMVHAELRRIAKRQIGTVKRDWTIAKRWLRRELKKA